MLCPLVILLCFGSVHQARRQHCRLLGGRTVCVVLLKVQCSSAVGVQRGELGYRAALRVAGMVCGFQVVAVPMHRGG